MLVEMETKVRSGCLNSLDWNGGMDWTGMVEWNGLDWWTALELKCLIQMYLRYAISLLLFISSIQNPFTLLLQLEERSKTIPLPPSS